MIMSQHPELLPSVALGPPGRSMGLMPADEWHDAAAC
jgi:hypothetical protein